MAASPASPAAPAARGVLLYYHYVSLEGEGVREAVRQWFVDNGVALGLTGRVRVAADGVNATLGGTTAALEAHARAFSAAYCAPGADPVDFKARRSPRLAPPPSLPRGSPPSTAAPARDARPCRPRAAPRLRRKSRVERC